MTETNQRLLHELKHIKNEVKKLKKISTKQQSTINKIRAKKATLNLIPSQTVSNTPSTKQFESIFADNNKAMDVLQRQFEQKRISTVNFMQYLGSTPLEILQIPEIKRMLIIEQSDTDNHTKIRCFICQYNYNCSKRSASTLCCNDKALSLTDSALNSHEYSLWFINKLINHFKSDHHRHTEDIYYPHDTKNRVLTYLQIMDVIAIIIQNSSHKQLEKEGLKGHILQLYGQKNLTRKRVPFIADLLFEIVLLNHSKLMTIPSSKSVSENITFPTILPDTWSKGI